ncbi:hypothetical protein DAPPUDRAFT_259579 [Daphnia pulex]|uniref:Uncharacterized protein n=1 Tax=Daphnia pulex TaxID=6669 RepID=E9HHG2_DAPPU|nr:hypothetical protein DAPPUDRAFT_259579 [Daphnia pulex]|eukprot:EFX68771.1 hypothetical protein DAPPUDRAFT_259579 [Daphnia pulex]
MKSMENETISAVVEAKDLVFHNEPYLIVVGTMEHPINFFLVIDYKAVPVGSDSSIALNCLLASFFVFGLDHPNPSSTFSQRNQPGIYQHP